MKEKMQTKSQSLLAAHEEDKEKKKLHCWRRYLVHISIILYFFQPNLNRNNFSSTNVNRF